MPTYKQLRVAVFTDTFDEVNGAAHTYRHLIRYAASTQKQVDVFCYTSGDQSTPVVTENQGPSRIFRIRPRYSVPYYERLSFELIRNPHLRDIFFANKYDLIHVAAPGSLGIQGLMLGHQSGLPVIGVFHTLIEQRMAHIVPPFLSKSVRRLSWICVRQFYQKCHHLLTTTPKMAIRLKRRGLTRKMSIFSRGVDTELFHPAKRTSDQPTVLYVGRLAEEKNLRLIAEAVKDSSPLPFRLMFVGDGPYRKVLERLIPEAIFTGYLHGDDLATAYANASLFVFPSVTDTFGNVVQEAMASGVPSLLLDRKGPGELIEPGVTGFLADSPDHFQELLLDLIHQPRLLKTTGERARRVAEGRSWNVVFDKLWNTYDTCASIQI